MSSKDFVRLRAVDGTESSVSIPLSPGQILQAVSVRPASTSGPMSTEILVQRDRAGTLIFAMQLARGWIADDGGAQELVLTWFGRFVVPPDLPHKLSVSIINNTTEDRVVEIAYSLEETS